MTGEKHSAEAGRKRRHLAWSLALAGLAATMLGLSFAAVPLYRLICQATGLNGTTQRSDANRSVASDRRITIRFDSNLGSGMPWRFAPAQRSLEVRLGETAMAIFVAENPTDRAVGGTATFNVTPEIAGRYFNKIQCFCFDEQTLAPHERVEMPVVFYVDPAILDEPGAGQIGSITLSYTFYEAAPKAAAATEPGLVPAAGREKPAKGS